MIRSGPGVVLNRPNNVTGGAVRRTEIKGKRKLGKRYYGDLSPETETELYGELYEIETRLETKGDGRPCSRLGIRSSDPGAQGRVDGLEEREVTNFTVGPSPRVTDKGRLDGRDR